MAKDRKYYRDKANGFIKTGVVDAALVLASNGWAAIGRGPIGWIAEKLFEYAWDKTGGKAIRLLIRKGYLGVDLKAGAIRVKKINKAKDENNADDYWDTISDI